MATRPPLPFGLGRDPACGPSCLQPGVPLPAPGTPLHDQVAHALSALFSTFYATSLRYLGVSEILDWIECNLTVDAWILTGLEQGRGPGEVGNEKNLEVGRGAIRSVIKAALEQEDEAWATSLREVGFSSGMSMAYEGIISQLKYNKTSPLPCLHTLITPSGLAMLKSAPLKHAFPICPPRTTPSPQSLLTSIRSLIASRALVGPAWKQASTWRPAVRKAFNKYHQMVKEVAEEVVCDKSFSAEYSIFLDSISQPIQLLQLISEDFETEFGPGACKGLLGVGDVGGQNLIQIMDFCAANRPSELLARVKQRVAEKGVREKRKRELQRGRENLVGIEEDLSAWRLEKEGMDEKEWGKRERWLGREKVAVEREIKELEERVREDEEVGVGGGKKVVVKEEEKDEEAFQQGSSKDLLYIQGPAASMDPFAATAPRAISPSLPSAKGKGRALTAVSAAQARAPSRYTSRTPIPPLKPSLSRASSRASSSPVMPPLYTPPPSPPRRAVAVMGRDEVEVENEDEESCCEACRMGAIEGSREMERGSLSNSTGTGACEVDEVPRLVEVGMMEETTAITTTVPKKKSKKKKSKAPKTVVLSSPLPTSSTPTSPPPRAPSFPHESLTKSGWFEIQKYLPTDACPPDRCTGDRIDRGVWGKELDKLVGETCLAGFKYELIDNLVAPLEFIRDNLAKQYLKMGGSMCNERGQPKEMDSFLKLAEGGMWSAVAHAEVQKFTQRTLAISLQKLVEVLKAQLGNVCICRLSNHPEILVNACHRLTQCELADRKIPIQLSSMDQQAFMKWCHNQLRDNAIGGPEWEGLNRSYRVSDFLLSFADAFDNAIDRMVDTDPYVLAEDLISLLEWQGGVRTFDMAMRLGSVTIPEVEEGGEGERPLEYVGKALSMSMEARAQGINFSRDLAETSKKLGNEQFAAGEFSNAITSFSTASLIYPIDPTYWTNAAAARNKMGTTRGYEGAVADCTVALGLEGGNVKALYRRGTALAMLNKWGAAMKDLEKLVEVVPDNLPAREALAWAVRRKGMNATTRN